MYVTNKKPPAGEHSDASLAVTVLGQDGSKAVLLPNESELKAQEVMPDGMSSKHPRGMTTGTRFDTNTSTTNDSNSQVQGVASGSMIAGSEPCT